MYAALAGGARAVKLFPAGAAGTPLLRNVLSLGPFSNRQFVAAVLVATKVCLARVRAAGIPLLRNVLSLGPFSKAVVLASGGILPEHARDWLDAGAAA
ncbi:hypothetical protein T484DRAFT_1799286, partial [Baffinella frigidus]